VNETRKILEDPTIQVTATTVRVPVYVGHSESVNIGDREKLSANEARAILSTAPGVQVYDDRNEGLSDTLEVAGKDEVYVAGYGRTNRSRTVSTSGSWRITYAKELP